MTEQVQNQTPEPASQSPGNPASTTTDQNAATAAATTGQVTAEVAAPSTAETVTTPQGAPESYSFQYPEGVSLSDEVTGTIAEMAKAGNLTQEQAQEQMNKLVGAYQTQVQAQMTEVRKSWVEQSQSDKEIGGDKFDKTMAAAKTALGKFSTPEFREFLEKSGMDVHPEMIRIFSKIGQAISEDSFVSSQGAPDGSQKPIEKRMFPNMN